MLDRFTGEHRGGVVRPRRRRTMPAAIPARSGTLQCPIWILESACATKIAVRTSPVTLDSRILLAGYITLPGKRFRASWSLGEG
jgi:hypothetical protein